MENALLTCIRVIVDEDCEAEDDVKALVGKHLAKMGAMPEVRSMLQALVAKMSAQETALLQKFVQ